MKRDTGVTVVEILTVVVALVVVVAVAVPLWRTHELRSHRDEAMKALLDVQIAQDRYFGEHARYADVSQLQIKPGTRRYSIEVKRSADELGYVASAVAVQDPGFNADERCARLSIDQHGRRSASNQSGEDSTADCWHRQ